MKDKNKKDEKNKKNKAFTFYATADLIERIRKVADEFEMTAGTLIRQALVEKLNEYEQKMKKQ